VQPILLYFSHGVSQAAKLQNVIQSVVQNTSFSVLRDLPSLEYFLHHTATTPAVVFLALASCDELLNVLMLKEELLSSNLVILLPNQSADMTAMAHQLHPRFVGYVDDDFGLISDVLARLIRDEEVLPKGKDLSGKTTAHTVVG